MLLKPCMNELTVGVSLLGHKIMTDIYEGWNFNSGNYLFTTDTK